MVDSVQIKVNRLFLIQKTMNFLYVSTFVLSYSATLVDSVLSFMNSFRPAVLDIFDVFLD